MEEQSFESSLKAMRIAAGKTVAEVSAYLVSLGYKASEKTIYSWEAGRSQPTPDPFLDMCIFYGVTDVLGSFGYKKATGTEDPAPVAEVFKLYDCINTALVSAGLLGEDADITPRQSEIVDGVCQILMAAFDG